MKKRYIKILLLGIMIISAVSIFIYRETYKNQIMICVTYIGECDKEEDYYFKKYTITKDTCTFSRGYGKDESKFEKTVYSVDKRQFNKLLKYLVYEKNFFFKVDEDYASGEVFAEMKVKYKGWQKRVYLGRDEQLYNKVDAFMRKVKGVGEWI